MSGLSNLFARRGGLRCEAIEKNREAAERRPAKTVNRLPVIADHHQVGALAAEQPEQFELRDVGVLEFVHQNVAIARAKFFAQRVVLAEPHDGVHDLRAERQKLALAQQLIARAIGPRNFLNFGDFLVAEVALVLGHRAAHAAESSPPARRHIAGNRPARPVHPGSARKIPRSRRETVPARTAADSARVAAKANCAAEESSGRFCRWV